MTQTVDNMWQFCREPSSEWLRIERFSLLILGPFDINTVEMKAAHQRRQWKRKHFADTDSALLKRPGTSASFLRGLNNRVVYHRCEYWDVSIVSFFSSKDHPDYRFDDADGL